MLHGPDRLLFTAMLRGGIAWFWAKDFTLDGGLEMCRDKLNTQPKKVSEIRNITFAEIYALFI